MKTLLFLTLSCILLIACQQDKSSPKSPNIPEKDSKNLKAQGKAKATFQVEGMVCKMGCGAAIRKDLLQSGCVVKVDIDFKEKAKEQTIIAHYDPSKIDITKMKAIIETTNEGQFKVTKTNSIQGK